MIDDRQAIIATLTFESGSIHAVLGTTKYPPEMISIENSKGEKKHNEIVNTKGYIGFADEPRSGHNEAVLKCLTAAR